jgi:hypothetical protein
MDAACELRGLIEVGTRGQQGGVQEKPNDILHGYVGLVRAGLLLKIRVM